MNSTNIEYSKKDRELFLSFYNKAMERFNRLCDEAQAELETGTIIEITKENYIDEAYKNYIKKGEAEKIKGWLTTSAFEKFQKELEKIRKETDYETDADFFDRIDRELREEGKIDEYGNLLIDNDEPAKEYTMNRDLGFSLKDMAVFNDSLTRFDDKDVYVNEPNKEPVKKEKADLRTLFEEISANEISSFENRPSQYKKKKSLGKFKPQERQVLTERQLERYCWYLSTNNDHDFFYDERDFGYISEDGFMEDEFEYIGFEKPEKARFFEVKYIMDFLNELSVKFKPMIRGIATDENRTWYRKDLKNIVRRHKRFMAAARYYLFKRLNAKKNKGRSIIFPRFFATTQKIGRLAQGVLVAFYTEDMLRNDFKEEYFLKSLAYMEKKFNFSHGAFMQGLNELENKGYISFERDENGKRIPTSFMLNLEEIFSKDFYGDTENPNLYFKADMKILTRKDASWSIKFALIASEQKGATTIKRIAKLVGRTRQAVSKLLNRAKDKVVKLKYIFRDKKCVGTKISFVDYAPPEVDALLDKLTAA